ncbi:MAG: hypothetical protein ABI639_08295 [Thermoanaerobaculia bacterium]
MRVPPTVLHTGRCSVPFRRGKSRYFGSGRPFDGSSRSEDVGSHEWKISMSGSDGRLSAHGVNAKGEKFANDDHLVACGDRLVLSAIAENPQ